MARRLLENHPLDKKFRRLLRFMEDEGIEIVETGMGLVARDKTTGVEAYVKNADDTDRNQDCVDTLPHAFEIKLIMFEG